MSFSNLKRLSLVKNLLVANLNCCVRMYWLFLKRKLLKCIVPLDQVLNFAFDLMKVHVFEPSKLLNLNSGFIIFRNGFAFDMVLKFF